MNFPRAERERQHVVHHEKCSKGDVKFSERDLSQESALKALWLCQLSMFVPDGCIIDGVVVWCSLTEPQPERAQQFASHLRQHLNKDEYHFFFLFSRWAVDFITEEQPNDLYN